MSHRTPTNEFRLDPLHQAPLCSDALQTAVRGVCTMRGCERGSLPPQVQPPSADMVSADMLHRLSTPHLYQHRPPAEVRPSPRAWTPLLNPLWMSGALYCVGRVWGRVGGGRDLRAHRGKDRIVRASRGPMSIFANPTSLAIWYSVSFRASVRGDAIPTATPHRSGRLATPRKPDSIS